MLIGICLFIPPCIFELTKANQVDTATSLCEELTSPLCQHLLHIEGCCTFWGIENSAPIRRRIVTLAYHVQEFTCCSSISLAQLTLCKAIDNLWETYLTVVCFKLKVLFSIWIERILSEHPTRVVVTILKSTFSLIEPLATISSTELTNSITYVKSIFTIVILQILWMSVIINILNLTEDEHTFTSTIV